MARSASLQTLYMSGLAVPRDPANGGLGYYYPQSGFATKVPRRAGYLKRKRRAHFMQCNPQNGKVEAAPRHTEISNKLAKKICRGLSIPDFGS